MNCWMKECFPVSIDINRAMPEVQKISEDAIRIGQHVTGVMNTISLTRAMQAGYAMACRDNGLPVPEMEDPAKFYGLM
jgi:hypothetical protein